MTKRKPISPLSDDEDAALLRTFTGWKLDCIRAVNADMRTKPGATALFVAIVDYANAETRQAWPSIGALSIKTNMSDKSIKKYLAELVAAKWIKLQGKSKRGTTIFEVSDERMNRVLDDLADKIDRWREREKLRKATIREKRREAGSVPEHGLRHVLPLSRNTHPGLSRNTGSYEHLQGTPSYPDSTERRPNPYAVAKGRG